MKKLWIPAVMLLFLVGCSGVPQGYWPVLPSPVTQKAKSQRVCIRMEGKEAEKYTLKLSLYPSKLSFQCVKPDMSYSLKKYIRSELSDFQEVYFLGPKDKAPQGCYLVTLNWEDSFKGYIKGGMGLLGKTYVIGGKVKGTLVGKKASYDCSVVGWDLVSEGDLHGPESYVCKDAPVEVFFNKVAEKLAQKMALRVRKALLDDMGYTPSPQLVEADQKMAQELKEW
jgi:hypothetical protein